MNPLDRMLLQEDDSAPMPGIAGVGRLPQLAPDFAVAAVKVGAELEMAGAVDEGGLVGDEDGDGVR